MKPGLEPGPFVFDDVLPCLLTVCIPTVFFPNYFTHSIHGEASSLELAYSFSTWMCLIRTGMTGALSSKPWLRIL